MARTGGERSFASTRRGDGVALMPDLPASHRLQTELRSPTQPLIPEQKASWTRDHFRIRFLHSYAQSFSIFDRLSPKNLASRCLDQRVWPGCRQTVARRSHSPVIFAALFVSRFLELKTDCQQVRSIAKIGNGNVRTIAIRVLCCRRLRDENS
jgi:hypothetical protein